MRLLVFLAAFPLTLSAADFYVSPAGNDFAAGSLAAPWRTIQKAADSLAPGDRVLVRAGTYDERVTVNVSGSEEDGPVVFANFPGERPIVTSSAQPPVNTDTGLIFIRDRSHVVVQGFEFANYKATTPANNQKRVPMGVHIRGASRDIAIRDCWIHGIWNDFADGNAFGIAVYGDTETPITDIVIDGCEISDCRLGNSESLAINGNVSGFEVTNNLVHDNSNIGIVAIGYEKTFRGTKANRELDRARDGTIRGNRVWNCTSTANPAYRNRPGAGGIYVDGGTRVLIEHNWSFQNDIGLEIASEHRGKASDFVVARNNWIWRNKVGGIFLGGYDAKRGRSENNIVRHNTLWENDTLNHGNGEIYLQHRVRNNTIAHNIVSASSQGYMLVNPRKSNVGNTIDRNLWFSPAGTAAQWRWKGKFRTGFEAWKTLSGMDANSLFADPLFADTASTEPDLHLSQGSPAVNAGDPSFVPSEDETDIDGDARVAGQAVDLGADER